MIVSVLFAIAVVSSWMLAVAGLNRLGLTRLAHQDPTSLRHNIGMLTRVEGDRL